MEGKEGEHAENGESEPSNPGERRRCHEGEVWGKAEAPGSDLQTETSFREGEIENRLSPSWTRVALRIGSPKSPIRIALAATSKASR